jgi:hypothetical protein
MWILMSFLSWYWGDRVPDASPAFDRSTTRNILTRNNLKLKTLNRTADMNPGNEGTSRI